MGEPSVWESPSSAFSTLEVSASQDSCYGSDETSITSTISSTPATSAVPSFVPSPKQRLSPILKPILKKEDTSFEPDTGSESGYDSDAEFEYSFMEDNDMEDPYEPSVWDEVSESESESDEESAGDSFISFESTVRFNPKVDYIEAPESQDEEITDSEMTFHEMIQLAATSGRLLLEGGVPENNSIDDLSDSGEHTPDAIDLDKRLFAAYINGINGVADSNYKSHLRARVNDIRSGRCCTPFFDSDNALDVYIDNVVSHVIGVFRNLVAKDEFDELVSLSNEKDALQQQAESSHADLDACNRTLLDKIESLLAERLGRGNVDISPDELTFFAGGVAHALGNSDASVESD